MANIKKYLAVAALAFVIAAAFAPKGYSVFSEATAAGGGGTSFVANGGAGSEVGFDTVIANHWPASSGNAFERAHIGDGIEFTASLVKGGSKSAVFSQIVKVTDGQRLSMDVSLPIFGSEIESGVRQDARYVELWMRGGDDASVRSALRIYVNHNYLTDKAFTATASVYNDDVKYETNIRILPVLTDRDNDGIPDIVRFPLTFDRENNFSGYFVQRMSYGGDGYYDGMPMTRLYDVSPDNQATPTGNFVYIADYRKRFDELFAANESAQFLIRLGMTSDAPDTGVGRMTLHSVCGQSYAMGGGGPGFVVDDNAPFVDDIRIVNGARLVCDAEYEIEQLGNVVLGGQNLPTPGRLTAFYSKFASDTVTSAQNLSYSVNLTLPSGAREETDGFRFRVGEGGIYRVSLTATDTAGNKYTTPGLEFFAEPIFRIVFDKSVPKTMNFGESLVLPTVYALDALGNTEDPATGEAYLVSITVKDALGLVTTDEIDGNVFTPKTPGTYDIRYSSAPADGSSFSKNFMIKVNDGRQEASKSGKKGCSGSLTAGGFAGWMLPLALSVLLAKGILNRGRMLSNIKIQKNININGRNKK